MTNTILITGAAGSAATGIRPLLRQRGHRLVLHDLAPVPDPDPSSERVVTADLLDEDVLGEAVRGADVVVHLGGFSRERPWSDILAINIDGTRAVLDAAVRAGVRRVLLASSTHGFGFWPIKELSTRSGPRPDTYYGVGKIASEALGSLYADRHGLCVVSARIGTVQAEPSGPRQLASWLSFPDFISLIEAAAQLEEPGHRVVWAMSANTRRWLPVTVDPVLGWEPRDDAERYADRFEADAYGFAGGAGDDNGLVGGAFADDDHPMGGIW
ncbi:NAD-dependent epimerase/dehydratase family protein [Phytoactinopolyspora mesophila]|uniref:NAD-dependent epimerase/dehydratase family protein n=1 Tax=Phytoactinopolyspora mesophila TaxID=2650750 RepID=A0A7K3LZR8_9ACTN|nr:NAD(P)-dependent oxidoreductase [Phytoactinopolyspora mesophila]NDL56531.1 NAD-dependent epimerase/dehydratase family protein [Phytoactinopolyspora mesophila]